MKNKVYDCYFVQNTTLRIPPGTIAELVATRWRTATPITRPPTSASAGTPPWSANAMLGRTADGGKFAILENNTADVLSAGGETITIDPATHRPTRDMGMYIATYDRTTKSSASFTGPPTT